uniref:Dehydrogenase n=1 Tax=Thermosporothrix sp. COM3 TaxID=2490863 RepID=A0A455SRA4_9CHLR|nr:dehydrogenase [Thermosporothrix sp. COM3]
MTVKIGIIGCGGIATPHINGYNKLPDAQVTAVCDIVEENARRCAELAGGATVFTDLKEMLDKADITAVDICLPHHLHKDAIVAAANAGKHILCEKPLCLTLDEAEAVKRAVDDNGVTLMCAHNQLFLPAVQYARRMVAGGTLGDVYEIRTTDSFYHSFDPSTIGWRANREFIGGGELIDTGYHPTYLLLYLANSKPVEVTAMLSNHRLHFMDGEDSAQVLVRFENGIVGNIVTSWAYEPSDNTEKFSIVAQRGYVYSQGKDVTYKMRMSNPPETITVKQPTISTFDAEIADFVDCLKENRRPINNEEDGINVLKIILGAYRSAKEKRTIEI